MVWAAAVAGSPPANAANRACNQVADLTHITAADKLAAGCSANSAANGLYDK